MKVVPTVIAIALSLYIATTNAQTRINGATTPALAQYHDQLILSYQREHTTHAELIIHNVTSGASQVIARGDNWFVNWADFPKLAINNDHWVTWFLQHSSEGRYAYDIMLMQSFDAGTTWTEAEKLHNDTTNSEHGFASIIPLEQGFQIAWLDGRNTQSGGHHNHGDTPGAMTLRTARINSDGSISDRTELDTRVCDCCQTELFAAPSGSMLAYRDRSSEEIRDTSVIMLGSEPHEPTQFSADDWHITGCPVNGPSGFFLDRAYTVNYTGADRKREVYIASDNGERISLSTQAIGRVDAITYQEHAFISFIDTVDNKPTVRILSFDGEILTDIASTIPINASRASGFPQLAMVDGTLFVALTTESGVSVTPVEW